MECSCTYFQLENTRGYTILLEKRLAADGSGLREDTINPNFATLSESSYYVAVDRHDKKFVCVLKFKNVLCRRKRNIETRRNYEIWPIK
jgi:SNW domain-containing protein 1